MKKNLLRGKSYLNEGGGAGLGQQLVPVSYRDIIWAKK